MRPKKSETTGEGDLFRARLDQIINPKHELVQLAGRIDWAWIDQRSPLHSGNGRPGVETRFMIGLLLLPSTAFPMRRWRPCACRKSNPNILVMQPAQDWKAKNTPCPLDRAR